MFCDHFGGLLGFVLQLLWQACDFNRPLETFGTQREHEGKKGKS